MVQRLTAFGQFVRIKRLERGMLLYEMANSLGVSSSMLSSVEAGRKRIPADWPSRVADVLALGPQERDELEKCIARSSTLLNRDNSKSSEPLCIAAKEASPRCRRKKAG